MAITFVAAQRSDELLPFGAVANRDVANQFKSVGIKRIGHNAHLELGEIA